MFIPTVHTKININDIVILNTDYNLQYGILTRGHEFIVKEILYKQLKVIDQSGLELILSSQILSKNFTIKESKKIYNHQIQQHKILKLIKQNCTKKDKGFDDRDIYDYCKLKKTHYSECIPTFDCIEYCNQNIESLKNISRFLKIKKLKKIVH
jgi:hypothetical protein